MNEVGGGGASEGASEEERAEAIPTPAEASPVEKDKTPEEAEAEKIFEYFENQISSNEQKLQTIVEGKKHISEHLAEIKATKGWEEYWAEQEKFGDEIDRLNSIKTEEDFEVDSRLEVLRPIYDVIKGQKSFFGLGNQPGEPEAKIETAIDLNKKMREVDEKSAPLKEMLRNVNHHLEWYRRYNSWRNTDKDYETRFDLKHRDDILAALEIFRLKKQQIFEQSKVRDAVTDEAYKFNELLKEGKVSPEYLSLVLEDQTPEQTEEIAEKALEKIQDVTEFGTVYHQTHIGDHDLEDIFRHGLKSRVELEEESVFFGKRGRGRILANFPYDISFSMKIKPGPVPVDWSPLEKNILREHHWWVRTALILNPQFITDRVEKGDRPLRFVGGYFHTPEGRQKTLDFLTKKGWLKESFQSPETHQPKDWEDTRDVFNDEVVVPGYRNEKFEELPIGGIVIRKKDSEGIIDFVNRMSEEAIKNAIPIYDQEGNLLWPIKLSHDQVKQFVAERDKKKAQEESEESESRK